MGVRLGRLGMDRLGMVFGTIVPVALAVAALARIAAADAMLGYAYSFVSAALLPSPLIVVCMRRSDEIKKPWRRLPALFVAGAAGAVGVGLLSTTIAPVDFDAGGVLGLVLAGGAAPLILIGGKAESTPWVPAGGLVAVVLAAVVFGGGEGTRGTASGVLPAAGLAGCLVASLLWSWRILAADGWVKRTPPNPVDRPTVSGTQEPGGRGARGGRSAEPWAHTAPEGRGTADRLAGSIVPVLFLWLPPVALRVASGFVPEASPLLELESAMYPALLLVVPAWLYSEAISVPRLLRAGRIGTTEAVWRRERRRAVIVQAGVAALSLLFAPGIGQVFFGVSALSWIVAVALVTVATATILTTIKNFVIDRV